MVLSEIRHDGTLHCRVILVCAFDMVWYYMNDVIQRRWGSLRCTITLLCTIGSLSPAFWSWVSRNDDIKELWQYLGFTIAVLSTIWIISLRSWNGYRKSWRELLWKVVICFQKMTYCFSICLIWEKRFYWFRTKNLRYIIGLGTLCRTYAYGFKRRSVRLPP